MTKITETAAETKAAWEIDFNRIKRKEITAFQEAYKRAEETQTDDALLPWMARVIVTWPFAGNPSTIEAYDELGLADYGEVAVRFIEGFQRLTAPKLGPGESGGAGS